jgi:transcriptional regulator with GAF, ATPase, and Fis domain
MSPLDHAWRILEPERSRVNSGIPVEREEPPVEIVEGRRWIVYPDADHAAMANANSRAFEEIARLRDQLERENSYLGEELRAELAQGEIVGPSAALANVMRQVELVASTDASVLILREPGTGKELIARAVHERSPRRGRTVLQANCAAIPRDLFESEFFGHVKGSFPGAARDRGGSFSSPTSMVEDAPPISRG